VIARAVAELGALDQDLAEPSSQAMEEARERLDVPVAPVEREAPSHAEEELGVDAVARTGPEGAYRNLRRGAHRQRNQADAGALRGAAVVALAAPAFSVAAQTLAPAADSTAAPIAIRALTAPAEGVFRVTYLVEGETGFVVIDAPLRKTDGAAVRAWIATLGKPLRGVIITHAHGDHNFGLTTLMGSAEAPVVSTRAVADGVRASEDGSQLFVPTLIGDAETERDRRFPDTFVDSGAPFRIDGVDFVLTDLGEAESAADSVVTMPAHPTALFVGDLVMPRVHQFLGNGTSGKLLAALRQLDRIATPQMLAYPGHSGVVPARAAINRQMAYVEAMRAAIRDVAAGRPRLTEAERRQVVALMQQFEPTRTLEFVIGLGADAVAQEIATA
jgi:glyoxylase-like metal-dependent hydrolase (beta-lactamase superfamily II)